MVSDPSDSDVCVSCFCIFLNSLRYDASCSCTKPSVLRVFRAGLRLVDEHAATAAKVADPAGLAGVLLNERIRVLFESGVIDVRTVTDLFVLHSDKPLASRERSARVDVKVSFAGAAMIFDALLAVENAEVLIEQRQATKLAFTSERERQVCDV